MRTEAIYSAFATERESATVTCVWQWLKGKHGSGKTSEKTGKASGMLWLEVVGMGSGGGITRTGSSHMTDLRNVFIWHSLGQTWQSLISPDHSLL